MLKRVCTLIILTLILVSCGSRGKTYLVGVDPSFYPTSLAGKESNVYAFSEELLRAISREEGVFFETVRMTWDNLIYGLKNKQYDGMLSSMTPRINREKSYIFSDLFLHTGPVLVVKEEAKISSIKHLKGQEISVGSLAQEALLIEKYPSVTVHYYDSVPEVFEEIILEQIEGALVNYLEATGYVRHLYNGQLKIATPPLNDAGLRLVTLNGESKELTEAFNRGLDKLRDNGVYEKLLRKWELD